MRPPLGEEFKISRENKPGKSPLLKKNFYFILFLSFSLFLTGKARIGHVLAYEALIIFRFRKKYQNKELSQNILGKWSLSVL